ncbi:helix-turn-helix transcriptional regulator [Chitinophaga japonensis]|uniref:AraC-like DNA-binding protein n=1 Tax=Chitinophaga japonensis TaxID=104662 RepID=A0A562TBW7_CHIJA|nr:AraC family transcriptional regulator [Chitinophaga japonensis]TWI90883.1 AraC-like DNA-binding protein [Chitinophaga japonensis]
MKYSFPDVPAHLVSVTREIPVQYKNYQYPFAESLLSTAPMAVILEQQMPVKGCMVSHHCIFVKGPVKLLLTPDETGPTLHCMMQGSADCRAAGSQKFRLYQGQYNLLQLHGGPHIIYLNPGLYASWEIDCCHTLLEELALDSPTAKKLLAKGGSLAAPLSGIIWNQLYQLISEINHSAPTRKITEVQLYGKLLEIQGMVLEDLDNAAGAPLPDANTRLFETIRSYLCYHLHSRPDLAQLARNFCISQSKLKQGFRKYYNTTVWHYHHKQRMEKSMQLLLQSSKSIADIAAELGYMPTNFTRDFKKFFGYPPRAHRHNGVGYVGAFNP